MLPLAHSVEPNCTAAAATAIPPHHALQLTASSIWAPPRPSRLWARVEVLNSTSQQASITPPPPPPLALT